MPQSDNAGEGSDNRLEGERWEAESYGAILTSGRTMPLQAGCFRRVQSSDKKERKQFLLKSLGHPEVTETGLFSEFLGNIMAQHFRISTPNPAWVTLSAEFVAATRGNLEFVRASRGLIDLRAGTAVACEYVSGMAPIARNFTIFLPRDIVDAARIFAFDMLVQNPDRTSVRKTNTALYNGRLVAFDFELCFSFARLIGGLPDPCQIDVALAREHLFYSSIRGKVHDWQPFVDDLLSLDDNRIGQTVSGLLEAFPECSRLAEKIARHLSQIRARPIDFRRELERSLA